MAPAAPRALPRPAALAVAALALTGCFRGGPGEGAVASPAPAADARGFLVWRDDGATRVTRWLDATGAERGRAQGTWLAHGGALWRVDPQGVASGTSGCRERDDGTIEPGEASFERLVLHTRDGARQLGIVTPPLGEAEGMASYAHTARVRASLGPLLLGEERVDAFACGAHGSVGVTAFAYDARTTTLTPVAAHPAGPTLAPVIEAAVEVAAARGEMIEALDPSSTWRVTETLPRWHDGVLGARALAVIDACYACTVGDWGSYSASVWVDAPRIPAAWAALAREVPRPVALALGADDAVATGVSWGEVDAAWRATFAAR